MDDFTATGIAEGFIECNDAEQVRAAWQHLVDTGLAYRLQGLVDAVKRGANYEDCLFWAFGGGI